MTEGRISTHTELTEAIDVAWSDLQEFLSSLTDKDAALRDDQGWTVADHVAHIAVWEDSVAFLFRGKPRHEALGIDEAFYLSASFDEINERVRQLKGEVSIGVATEELREVHKTLIGHLAELDDEALHETVEAYFRAAPKGDQRRVIDLIYENTANHYLEHLGWMRTLVGRAA